MIVIVVATVIVDVHVHGNDTVIVAALVHGNATVVVIDRPVARPPTPIAILQSFTGLGITIRVSFPCTSAATITGSITLTSALT